MRALEHFLKTAFGTHAQTQIITCALQRRLNRLFQFYVRTARNPIAIQIPYPPPQANNKMIKSVQSTPYLYTSPFAHEQHEKYKVSISKYV